MALILETRIGGKIEAPLTLGSVRIFVLPGIPPTATGSNTDLYFDEDAAKSSYRPTLYQKQAGSWVGVA